MFVCVCVYVPQVNIKQLAGLTRLVRGDLTGLARRTVAALITIDVHARDIVSDLAKRGTKVQSLHAPHCSHAHTTHTTALVHMLHTDACCLGLAS